MIEISILTLSLLLTGMFALGGMVVFWMYRVTDGQDNEKTHEVQALTTTEYSNEKLFEIWLVYYKRLSYLESLSQENLDTFKLSKYRINQDFEQFISGAFWMITDHTTRVLRLHISDPEYDQICDTVDKNRSDLRPVVDELLKNEKYRKELILFIRGC